MRSTCGAVQLAIVLLAGEIMWSSGETCIRQ